MIIYIRHGKDTENGYAHDAKLTKEGKLEIHPFTEKLIEENGIPDVIYFSPFYRARKTVKEMIRTIKRLNIDKEIKIILDPRLGRFFNSKERESPKVHKKTLLKGAIIQDDKKQFKKRITDQLNFVKMQMEEEKKIIWNVTHALVLVNIAKTSNIKRDLHIKYLDTIILTV